MTLSQFIKDNGLTVDGFARQLGVSRHTIHKIVYGQRQPSLALAAKIVAATGGTVGHDDLLLRAA